MRTVMLPVAMLLAAALISPAKLCAQAAVPPLLTNYAGVAISPNGSFVADVQSKESLDLAKDVAQHLFIREVATKEAREIQVPCGGIDGCTVSVPVWSPDSRSIAYVVRAAKSSTREMYIADVTGPALTPGAIQHLSPTPLPPVRLLSFTGTLGSLKYSHDGTKLAMLAVPNARKEVGATQAGASIVGEIGSASDEQRIAVVSLANPSIVYASPSDLFVYEYDWMPDATGFVGTAAHGDGDNNWWIARLYRFDASSATATQLYRPASAQQQIASPRVSPDEKSVAFIGGIMSDFGSTGGDVYVVPLSDPSSRAIDITPNAKFSVTSIAWLCDFDSLIATDLKEANNETSLIDPKTRLISAIDSGMQTSFAGNGDNVSFSCPSIPNFYSFSDRMTSAQKMLTGKRFARISQTFETAPEIVVDNLPISAENGAIPSEANARSITWTSDGASVQGWLLEPKHLATNGKRALITVVHGGPAAANVPRFIGRGTVRDLLRHGYAVFLPNSRGSFGQGEAFTLANVKDFGYGDLRDILTGIDAVEKSDPTIDDAKLGITGGSYGGFMTMWAVTQTDRFKAAVAGAGISDWISYYGENGIDEWMIPYFGSSAYDDPAVYRKSSAIDFIKNVKTPTFEYVGERDVECPAPQSQEFWHALVADNVPTSLVIYAGEGHHIRMPTNQNDVTRRTLAWFDAYLKP